jgi:hypothetical protein
MLMRLARRLVRRQAVTPEEAARLYRAARGAPLVDRSALRSRAAHGFAAIDRLSEDHLFDAARLHLDRGDMPAGLAAVDRLIERRPDHVAALHLKSLMLIRENRFGAALTLARDILALQPDHAAARYHLRTLADLDGQDGPPQASGAAAPLLVGIGSGIGNMLHTGPMLVAIARHFGRPVDLVVAAEGPGTLFLLRREGIVGRVLALGRAAIDRRYDRVFLTHSFGAIRPAFATDNLLAARDWQPFDPAGPLHETAYNLEAARALLGVPMPPDFAELAFVDSLDYAPPAEGPIGFHAGSKGGTWAQKRWPHFAALAERLNERGFACASFGTADEYVPGTIDLTGGSVEEMARAMLACRHFVANDSGVMNIANALGIPLTAIFGPTNPATRGPLGRRSTIVMPQGDYVPEETDPAGKALFRAGLARSIDRVTVDQVEAAVLSVVVRNLGV